MFERGVVAFYALARALDGADWLGVCWDGTTTYYHRSVLAISLYFHSGDRPVCRFAALPEMVSGKTATEILAQIDHLFQRLRAAQTELGIPEARQAYLHLVDVAISDNENTNTGERYVVAMHLQCCPYLA